MRILVLSPRLTESRRAAFRALTQGLGELHFLAPGEPAPDVGETDAIVVDGPQPAQPLAFPAARIAPRNASGWADQIGRAHV